MTETKPRRRPRVTLRAIESKLDIQGRLTRDMRDVIDRQVIGFLAQSYSSEVIGLYMGKKPGTVRWVISQLAPTSRNS